MSDLKVTGTIKKILEVQKGTSKAGKEWEKIDFVLDTGAEYNSEICFTIFGSEKVENFVKYNKEGQDVDVSFNVSSREYDGKWFHNIGAWKVFKADTQEQPVNQDNSGAESDGLPF
jgi:hypothetical protein